MITNRCLTGGSPLPEAPGEPLPDPPLPPPVPFGRLGRGRRVTCRPWPAGSPWRRRRRRRGGLAGSGSACASGGSPAADEDEADDEDVDVGAAAVAESGLAGQHELHRLARCGERVVHARAGDVAEQHAEAEEDQHEQGRHHARRQCKPRRRRAPRSIAPGRSARSWHAPAATSRATARRRGAAAPRAAGSRDPVR